ncbi:MAG: hypothetical protein NTX85_04125 [Candidatus Nomurabacteria bacterium]|nr:hypothetical protein [Candidatus Nomurabacteria bacterium]
MNNENTKGNIGVFDSGLGGLWILKHIRELLPEYNYVFYGDQKNVPYGNKSKNDLFVFTTTALAFLYGEQNCVVVLLACNTTSTAIYPELKEWVRENYPDRLLFGIAHPTVESISDSNGVMVFATHRTVDSHFYKESLEEKNIETHEFVLPELASIIEKGGDVSAYLDQNREVIPAGVDSVVLGCTHYGIAVSEFKNIFPNVSNWILQEEITPPFLEKYIKENQNFNNKLALDGSLIFYITGENPIFQKYGQDWYGDDFEIKYL